VIPPELWNKVGIRVDSQTALKRAADAWCKFCPGARLNPGGESVREIQQALADLELTGKIKVELR
jgi:hypothetical protein